MIEAMSPFTRRFAAVGLLVLIVISAISFVIVPVFASLRFNLQHLGDVRFERAKSDSVVGSAALPPPPAFPLGSVIQASDRDAAASRLVDLGREVAAGAGLANAQLSPASSDQDVARVGATIQVLGPELAVVQFVNMLEKGQPLVRLDRWQLSRGEKGAVQLTAHLVAPWTQR